MNILRPLNKRSGFSLVELAIVGVHDALVDELEGLALARLHRGRADRDDDVCRAACGR